jgi:hypothetical protein
LQHLPWRKASGDDKWKIKNGKWKMALKLKENLFALQALRKAELKNLIT